jgi:hypothetical protein
MRARVQRLQRDETGMSLIYVGLGMMTFFAATTLAIDVGMFMTARTQAQTAADAGALAGATALVYNSFDDRSLGGPIVQSAVNTALQNQVIGKDVSAKPTDVSFPLGSNGTYNRVRIGVFRTTERLNPVATLVGPVFGVPTIDISAFATAEATPANAMTCVKPFTIPDKWVEKQDASWSIDSTFDRYDNKGNVIANPDVYIPPGQPGYKGYTYKDTGTIVRLRSSNGNKVAPTMYWSWKMPEAIGGSFYEENIKNCNTSQVGFGDIMFQEPGNMMGPTLSGVDALMAKDPSAHWDEFNNTLVSSQNPSPRVFPIPLYDPDYYQGGVTTGRNATLRVANWIGFFIEGHTSNEVYGRLTPITGVVNPNLPSAPAGTFPLAIRLVQ